jgi:ribosomal RNA-processing protein 12
VVKSALGFIKVFMGCMDSLVILPHLAMLVRALLCWSNEHHQNFKVRVRHLIERLVKKFGHDAVLSVTPPSHHKLLNNIRKRRERLKRRKEASANPEQLNVRGNNLVTLSHMDADGDDALSRSAITGISALTKMTALKGATLAASNRFESAINDSESDFGSDEPSNDEESDGFDLPADSILNDIENVEDDEEIDRILGKKLTLAADLSGNRKKGASKKRVYFASGSANDDNDDSGVEVDASGRIVINDPSDEELEEDEKGEELDTKRTNKRPNSSMQQRKSKKMKSDSRKKHDKFEPYSYVPMSRANGKKGKSKSISSAQKYFLKRS